MSVTNNQQNPVVSSQDVAQRASPGGKTCEPIFERLDAATVTVLTRLARAQQAGLHALLLTVLGAEARRRNGRSTLIIGSGISVRPAEADTATGYVVNLLPLVLNDDNGLTLGAQICAAQATWTEAIEHDGHPSHAQISLFDISLTKNPARNCADVLAHPATGIDLAFSYEAVEDNGGDLELSLAWNPDVFNRNTAEAWLRSFAIWARWLAEDVGRADAPLPALLPDEALCLARWERGPVRMRPAQRFHELFEGVADRQPHRPAVVTDAGIESYAELEHQANRIARMLLDHGVAREEPVAVLTECSARLAATVLGIWKAGGAYLPLVLEQPPERLAYMARDGGARLLIALDGHAVPASLGEAVKTILRPEDWELSATLSQIERPEIAGTPQDLAYIIYTSGTSGIPKGVLVQHNSLVNTALMSGETFGLTPEDRISLVAAPGFDASLWELGMGLSHGMAFVPVSRTLRDDPWALKQCYKTLGVTVAFHTPSYLHVSQQTPFDGLRILLTGGEAPNHDDARHYAAHLALWNAYGPAEACIFVCAEQISAQPDMARPLAVGRPLANTRISIRRDNRDPALPGMVGEVWLGGTGLARGYLNNPDLTAECKTLSSSPTCW